MKYMTASGTTIANEGEKRITMMTNGNAVVSATWRTVEVNRPLSSVRQICLQGNRVTFGALGGVIHNIETGRETRFGIENSAYVLDLWIPPAGDFQRHG